MYVDSKLKLQPPMQTELRTSTLVLWFMGILTWLCFRNFKKWGTWQNMQHSQKCAGISIFVPSSPLIRDANEKKQCITSGKASNDSRAARFPIYRVRRKNTKHKYHTDISILIVQRNIIHLQRTSASRLWIIIKDQKGNKDSDVKTSNRVYKCTFIWQPAMCIAKTSKHKPSIILWHMKQNILYIKPFA